MTVKSSHVYPPFRYETSLKPVSSVHVGRNASPVALPNAFVIRCKRVLPPSATVNWSSRIEGCKARAASLTIPPPRSEWRFCELNHLKISTFLTCNRARGIATSTKGRASNEDGLLKSHLRHCGPHAYPFRGSDTLLLGRPAARALLLPHFVGRGVQLTDEIAFLSDFRDVADERGHIEAVAQKRRPLSICNRLADIAGGGISGRLEGLSSGHVRRA